MKQVEQLAAFVMRASFADLSEQARACLKIRVLDSFGCALGALDGEPVRHLRAQLDEFGGASVCTLIGGGRSAPDRAAGYTTALTRYLDFMDNYMAKDQTCHPCDNLGSVLAAAEYADQTGKEFLTALAVAYQVQCRLTDEAQIMQRGFDHTTHLSFAIAAGVARALRLDETQTANAISICGAEFNALAVTRASPTSQWKGLASANTAFGATHATFLARRGVTGPIGVFEGPKGFMEACGHKFEIDWAQENLERVTRTSVKRYNAEVHSQSALEGMLELRAQHGFTADEVEQVEIEIFHEAYNIIGGGEYGDRTHVETKEQADHSLPYLIAVAIIDGQVEPEQFAPERIKRADVQSLLRKVSVRPHSLVPGVTAESLNTYSWYYPKEMRCQLTVSLHDGRELKIEKKDYEGFYARPASWATAVEKFERLSARAADTPLRREIAQAVADLEAITVGELVQLIAKAKVPVA
ncbi:MAG: MmgE/PrpD family protein [Pyrinomonadaceae bacterium]